MATTAQLSEFAAENRDSISAEQLREINILDEGARLDQKVVEKAAQDLSKGKSMRVTGATWSGSPTKVVSAVIVGVSPSLVVVLVLIAVVAQVLSRALPSRDLPTVGPVGQTLAVLGACVVSVVVFGLAPSRIVSSEIQAWVLTVLVIITPIIIVSVVAWGRLRRRAFKFSLRAVLVSMSLLCVLLGLVSITQPETDSFTQIPFDLTIPARGWGGLGATSLEKAILPLGNWLWAVLQWCAYYGHFLTVAIWAGMIAVLLWLKVRSVPQDFNGVTPTCLERMGALCRSLGRPSLLMAALTLVLYLFFLPGVVDAVEQEFQSKMSFARNPNEHWSKVEQAVQKVRSNGVMMEQLMESVLAGTSENTPSDARD